MPIGIWPKDEEMKELGTWQLHILLDTIEPFTLGFIGTLDKSFQSLYPLSLDQMEQNPSQSPKI